MDRDLRLVVVRQRDARDAPDRHAADLHLVAPDELAGFAEDRAGSWRRRRRRTGDRATISTTIASAPNAMIRPARGGSGPERRTGAEGLEPGGGGGAGGLGGLTVAIRCLPAGARSTGLVGDRRGRGSLATVGSGISPSRAISLIHSLALSPEPNTPAACARRPAGAAEAEVDGAGVGPRERVGGARIAHRADDLEAALPHPEASAACESRCRRRSPVRHGRRSGRR